MKTSIALGFILFVGGTALLKAQNIASQPVQTKIPPPPTAYAITGRDANSRTWKQQTYQLSQSGQVVTNIHGYTELTPVRMCS